jgi:predicted ATPase
VAEEMFERALLSARQQQARSVELRVATSLAHLIAAQGRREEAQAALAPVYDWFAEGFDTADLMESKALLNVLA